MDTLGIEPRASRMLSGCDTTTPCARLHGARWALQASGIWYTHIPQRGCYPGLCCPLLPLMRSSWALAASGINPTARGFEPLRAEPNGFLVHHLSHSVTLSMLSCKTGRLAERASHPSRIPYPSTSSSIAHSEGSRPSGWTGHCWLAQGHTFSGDLVLVTEGFQTGYIAQWLERLTADQQVPGSNPGVPFF